VFEREFMRSIYIQASFSIYFEAILYIPYNQTQALKLNHF